MRRVCGKFELSADLVHPLVEMTMQVSDAELVQAAQAGEIAALGVLLERHQARLHAVATRLLGSSDMARDAVQETFVIALCRLTDLRDPSAVAGWLSTTVRNVCLMQLRSRREVPVDTATFDPPGPDQVEEILTRSLLRDWVWTALEELPGDLQATVMLRYFTARSAYAQIATTLGIPVGTVRSRLNQARRRLADAVLRTASAAHTDHRILFQERQAWWTAAADQIVRHGDATLYAEGCLADVVVEAASLRYRQVGITDHQQDVARCGAAGVQLHLTELLTSRDVTVISGTYRNPDDDPYHCPDSHTEIRIHPGGHTRRLILSYGTHDRSQTSAAEEAHG